MSLAFLYFVHIVYDVATAAVYHTLRNGRRFLFRARGQSERDVTVGYNEKKDGGWGTKKNSLCRTLSPPRYIYKFKYKTCFLLCSVQSYYRIVEVGGGKKPRFIILFFFLIRIKKNWHSYMFKGADLNVNSAYYNMYLLFSSSVLSYIHTYIYRKLLLSYRKNSIRTHQSEYLNAKLFLHHL